MGFHLNLNTFLIKLLFLSLIAEPSFRINAQGKSREIENNNLFYASRPLKEVLEVLSKRFDKKIFYADNLIHSERLVSIDLNKGGVDSLLNKLLLPLNIDWRYLGKDRIILVSSTNNVLISDVDTSITVSGVVRDESGSLMEGVAVILSSGKIGTLTNKIGEFSISNVSKGTFVTFKYVGYKSLSIASTASRLSVKMERSLSSLDEKVVIGYGASIRRNMVGSVYKVSGRDLAKQPITDPVMALQGRVPGLYIRSSSGVPGSNPIVSLRGKNSIANNNQPLYILDGIPYSANSLSSPYISARYDISPFNGINVSDIESIEILKDADATAIYGARGANGVVLITTKKGKAGKAELDINFYTGIGQVSKRIGLLNLSQYLEMRHEALRNDGISIPQFTDYDINGKWDTTRSTDWQEEFLGRSTSLNNLQLSLSGGSETTQFSARIGGSKQTLAFPGAFSDKVISGHFTINHTSLDKKLSVAISTGISNNVNNLPSVDLTNNILLAPNAPRLYDSDGKLNWEEDTWLNPYADLQKKVKSISDNWTSSINLGYRILRGLEFRVNVGYNNIQINQSNKTPISAYSPSYSQYSSLRSNALASTKIRTLIGEPQLNYKINVSDLSISAMVGGTLQDNIQSSTSELATDFLNDDLIDNTAAASSLQILQNLYSQYRYLSVFTRTTIDFKGRYMVNLAMRRDGSSRFGPGRQFGNFGSIGAAWIFSDEPLMKKSTTFLSFGKIRASYGTTGIEPSADYSYLSRYSVSASGYLGTQAFYPSNLANNDYRWEMVRKKEASLELGFFKDLLLLNVSYYNNKTTDQLVGYRLPSITGFTSIQSNMPAKVRNTGWEFEIVGNNLNEGVVKWSSGLVLSILRNKLLSYENLEGSSYANSLVVGRPLTISRKFRYIGLDKQTGVYVMDDINKDGRISAPQDWSIIIDNSPAFFGGCRNNFSFRDFDLFFLLNFVSKQAEDIYASINVPPGTFNSNQPTGVMSRWREPGDISPVQRFTQGGGLANQAYYPFRNTKERLESASFVRMQNVSISYNFPKRLLARLAVKNARVYFQANNLFTITRYSGFDPDVTGLTYPTVRMLTLGLQATL